MNIEAAHIDPEHSSPPLIPQHDSAEQKDHDSNPIEIEVELPKAIADVEPVTMLCPIVEPTPTLPASIVSVPVPVPESRAPTTFTLTPSLSELSGPLSPLSSPANLASPRPSSPLSEPPSPVSVPLDVWEDDRDREDEKPVKAISCEQKKTDAIDVSVTSRSRSGTSERETDAEMRPVAGPSKPRVVTDAKKKSTKRKFEDVSAVQQLAFASPDLKNTSATQDPAKEKKKRQRRTKVAEAQLPETTDVPSTTKGENAPKPRKRQPKKVKDGGHETSKPQRASSSTPSGHDRNPEKDTTTGADAQGAPPSASAAEEVKQIPTDESGENIPIPRAELAGLLVQTMALSRASSMPPSTLLRTLLSTTPHLTTLSSPLTTTHITSVLTGFPYFDKIERQGLDAHDKPLEGLWFYCPERDDDRERAALLGEMMPKPKKRSATMRHKQYFYKPLGASFFFCLKCFDWGEC